MADILLQKPIARQIISLTPQSQDRIIFAFAAHEVLIERVNDNLVFFFDEGARVELLDFYITYNGFNMPDFVIENHTVPGEEFFAALDANLMPATGPADQPESSGSTVQFGTGYLLAGVDATDGVDQEYANNSSNLFIGGDELEGMQTLASIVTDEDSNMIIDDYTREFLNDEQLILDGSAELAKTVVQVLQVEDNNTLQNLANDMERLIGDARIDNDVIYGSDGADVLIGLNGDDILFGGNNADIILAGSGDDLIGIDIDDIFVDGGEGDIDILLSGVNDEFTKNAVIENMKSGDITNIEMIVLGKEFDNQDVDQMLSDLGLGDPKNVDFSDPLWVARDEHEIDSINTFVELSHDSLDITILVEKTMYESGTV